MAGPITTAPSSKQGDEVQAVSVRKAQRIYGDDAYPVWYRRPLPLDASRARRPDFPAGPMLLRKGTVRREGALPLPCEIVLERDVEVTLRDGTRIYTDVYRPTAAGRYPVIFGWSPYGKDLGGQWLDDFPHRAGVPLSAVSEFQRFEGPDPAYWVDHGYVVLSPDPRGAGRSEGDLVTWGRQLAEDGHDFVEWAAAQPWSNGRIGMTGNSYLAISQWFIAAEQPPHLAAIAPWEGFSRTGVRGGVVRPTFPDLIQQTLSGCHLAEDQPRMIGAEPSRTPYWRDKEARLARVTVPAYVVASWTNPAHTEGTFAGYRGIASTAKWLRVHNTHEWVDYYDPAHVEDLRRFFDHYLRDVANDWPQTPPVRMCVLDPGGQDVVDRVEKQFPLARTEHRRLHLTADGHLSTEAPADAASIEYEVGAQGAITFTTTFAEPTELTGYFAVRLWVEARGSDDMELSVLVQKVDAAGRPFMGRPMTMTAANGVLRVSQRQVDAELSTPAEPVLLGTGEELLEPGQIVPVDIPLTPMGMIFRPGETLQLVIGEVTNPRGAPAPRFGRAAITVPADGGTYEPGTAVPMVTLGGDHELPAFALAQAVPQPPFRNAGTHVVHVGGRFDSSLLVPVVPAS